MEHAETTRLEAFSDGIFAIAITLLILEVRAPEAHDARELVRALLAQWASYAGYVLSFILIGIMWSNHTHIFRLIKRTDHLLTMINTLLLMTIAFLPFPTSVLARNIRNAATAGPAVVLYSGCVLLTALPWSWLWLHAVHAGLVEGPAEEVDRVTRSFRFGWIPWLITTIVAFFAPVAAMIGLVVLTLYWLIFPGRRTRA